MRKHIVISGTYSTGKTTTATALSIATGIPMIDASSAREILTSLYPGRRFQDMSITELMALGLSRFEQRVKAETILMDQDKDFISDGSVLNEWVYGTVRLKIGINPGAPVYQQIIKDILGIPTRNFLDKYMKAYGRVVNQRALATYTHVVHLPIEFPMVSDGHRPVSERYRRLSDIQIAKTLKGYGIPFYTVGGTQRERVLRIIELVHLPQLVSIDEAVNRAEKNIQRSRDMVSQRMIEQYHKPSLKEKLKILSHF
ncbi:MAG: ATP-binding protein [Lentilactobacillus hilgardii]|uniref:ATP/GTP-binding protein n=1 Tax=Lactobacillaceae TaxID=33958 RepID=UPI0039EA7ECC